MFYIFGVFLRISTYITIPEFSDKMIYTEVFIKALLSYSKSHTRGIRQQIIYNCFKKRCQGEMHYIAQPKRIMGCHFHPEGVYLSMTFFKYNCALSSNSESMVLVSHPSPSICDRCFWFVYELQIYIYISNQKSLPTTPFGLGFLLFPKQRYFILLCYIVYLNMFGFVYLDGCLHERYLFIETKQKGINATIRIKLNSRCVQVEPLWSDVIRFRRNGGNPFRQVVSSAKSPKVGILHSIIPVQHVRPLK